MSSNPKILLVDDEPLVVGALARMLKASYEVRTAESGEAALAILQAEPDVAVVISDMRMPKMNGAAFLTRARSIRPDAVRVLLTGDADIDEAIDAVNHGNIFRFLRKPCDAPTLRNAISASLEQRRLILAEKTLLEETLRGAVQALCATLSLTSPTSFGLGTRIKQVSSGIGKRLGIGDSWRLEVAAMLAQLGAVSVPPAVFERKVKGEHLSIEDRAMLDRIPEITDKLLASIPRLEDVRIIVRQSQSRAAADPGASLEARILRAATDFAELERATGTAEKALEIMQLRHSHYDPKVLGALAQMQGHSERLVEIPLVQLREGMVVAADVRTKGGMLLVTRGHEVTAAMLGRLENFAGSLDSKTVYVIERVTEL